MNSIPTEEAQALQFECDNPSVTWPMSLTRTISACAEHMPPSSSHFPIIVAWLANKKRQLSWEEVKPFHERYRDGLMWVTTPEPKP